MATNTTDLVLSNTEQRALDLLGRGILPTQVAAAIGVTDSAISQMLAKPEFAELVASLRYKNLLKHSERDTKADDIEDKLLKKLDGMIPFMMRPAEVVRAYQVVNGAKRRGSSAPEQITAQQEVVQLIMPVSITNQFTVNSANQVISAGQQPLITVQSGTMKALLDKHKESKNVPLLPSGKPESVESR